CALAACGDDGGSEPQPMVEKDVGTAGGTVTLAGGPTLTIPANSLSETTTIRITDLGPFAGAVTSRYQFEPDGLTFSIPATITFPVAPTATLRVFWTKAPPMAGYDELTPQAGASAVTVDIMHFSNGFVAPMG